MSVDNLLAAGYVLPGLALALVVLYFLVVMLSRFLGPHDRGCPVRASARRIARRCRLAAGSARPFPRNGQRNCQYGSQILFEN